MSSTLGVENISHTNGTNAMTVSSGGVVTFSNPSVGDNASVAGTAAFAARVTAVTGWAAIASGAIVPFDNDSTGDNFDTDSVFNTSTYKFVAPATGVYMFWYGIYTAQSIDTNGFGFLKNAAKLNMQASSGSYFTFSTNNVNDHIQTATVVVPLASEDTMAVCATFSGNYAAPQSQWGGCRLA